MKLNVNKRHLSIVVISLLVCLMFVSCRNIDKETALKNDVAQGTEESKNKVEEPKEESNEGNKDTEEVKEENEEEENVAVEEEKSNEQIIQENEEVIVEEVDSYREMICIVNNVYLSNNKRYIDVDQIEFFRGDSAYEEARKDGNLGKDENGKEFLPDGYYIRNNYNTIETYEVSDDSIFKLCVYIVDPGSSSNSAETLPVSYEEYESYINSKKGSDIRARMFWVNTKNNVVESIKMQYTP